MNALKNKWLWFGAGLAVGVPVFALGWWLLSPLFFDTEVDEAFPLTENAVIPAGVTQSDAETVMMTMSKLDAPMEEAMPKEMSEPTTVAVKSGEFQDADRFHTGEGTATIYRLDDGSHVLRLENFRVTNGPELHVLLAKGSGPGLDTGYEDLGLLKGNVGNQNYSIPNSVDPSEFNSIVIYCKPFRVEFSVATLN